MPEAPLTLAAYTLELPWYACARLRLSGPLGVLTGLVRPRMGARTDGVQYALSADVLPGADVVLFQRYFPMERTWPLVDLALSSGAAVVYDLDDNFLAVPQDHPMAEALAPVRPWAEKLLRLADLVTVSTPELAEAVAPLCRRVRVLPNLVDPGLWRRSARAPQREPNEAAHVVFAGTPSHRGDLEALAPALSRLQAHFGPRMVLTLMGCDAPELSARRVPFEPDYAAYARALAGLGPDIGLAPLSDSAFNRCKSAVKWLEYSALGAAGVYADLPPYAPVENGRTGVKVGAAPALWEEALAGLLEDAVSRRRLGRQARAEVFGRHRLDSGAAAYLEAWREAVRMKTGRETPRTRDRRHGPTG
ncbi:glycosyltransferase family protein [Fundidesulfovibrio butyratiphilus]